MINIYYGRESMDKSKFMFSKIGEKAILIVPDQYTLQAERDALKYLNTQGIMDIQIMGFSRFASGILKEAGVRMDVISREGREMLLAGIIRKCRKDLQVFKGSAYNINFVTTMHDFIAEMKQSNATPIELEKAIETLKDGTLLKNKLKDVYYIYDKYCQAVAGKYMDNEDFMSATAEKIIQVKSLENTEIWLYGFDSFTGKHYSIIRALNERGLSINPVLTWDEKSGSLFESTTRVIRKLEELAASNNEKDNNFKLNKIPDEFARNRKAEISHLEKNYEEIAPQKIKSQGSIKLVRCSNPYSEACSAAAWILHLIRDEGYRLRDISLICNNIEDQKELYQRVFKDYGIELFVDSKRDAKYHPVMTLILSLMKIVSFEYQREDIIKYIKTGLVGLTTDEINRLEIYAFKYKIDGHKWIGRFRTGLTEYTAEEIEEFEKMRQRVITPLGTLKRAVSEEKTIRGKIIVLYKFLDESLQLRQQLENLVSECEETGKMDLASETSQLWSKIVEIFQQMIVLLGDEEVSESEFIDLLRSGISSIEIGVIPPAADGLVMGNIQRSRRENVKASVIVYATEGVLPEGDKKGGIVSDEERNLLAKNNMDICKVSRLAQMEERLALYRNLTRPSESLYISYPMADQSGSGLEPSQVIAKIQDFVEGISFEEDIFKKQDEDLIMGGYDATKNSLIMALADAFDTGEIKEHWVNIYHWFNKQEDMNVLINRLFETFEKAQGDEKLIRELYGKFENLPLRISPSRLELFGKCPFSHFVKYGLKPEEIRQYEIGPSEAGTVFHNCLMILSKKLSENTSEMPVLDGEGQGNQSNGSHRNITDENSLWMTVTRDQVHEMIDDILKDISKDYKEGLLSSGKYEQYRAKRIQKVCEDSAWMAIRHVRKGLIKEMRFEVPFGRSMSREKCWTDLPGMLVDTSSGQISIEGQIDRWDIVEGDFNKIIDYKSGNDTFELKQAQDGIKLQLFIYLMAVTSEKYKPGGAFYFHIDEGCEEVPDDIRIVSSDLINQYKMDGFALGNEELLKAIDQDEKITVYKKSKKRIFSEYEFNNVLEEIHETIERMSSDILGGKIAAMPKKINSTMTSCTYCPYKGICKFDITMPGCKYNMK